MATASYFLSRIGESVTCPVCFHIFVKPKTIPTCGHTFCEDCIQLVVQHRTAIDDDDYNDGISDNDYDDDDDDEVICSCCRCCYTPCLKKTVQTYFLSELCQISTDCKNFWQKDSRENSLFCGILIFHFT